MRGRPGTWSQVRPRPSGLNPLTFSSANFPSGAPTSGTIIGATPGSVLSFSRPLAGLTINSAARTWEFDGRALPGFGSFMIRETLEGLKTAIRDTPIAYTNIAMAPTLGTLSLSSTSFVVGTAASGTIIGAAAGSTIAVTGQPTGFSINSVARTWAYDGTGTATSGSLTLTETLPTLGPKNTVIAYTVAAAAVTLGTVALSSSSYTAGTASSGAITGATSGSTLSLSGAPAGFTINSGARTWAFDGSASAGSGTLTITETLTGATNTPKANSIGWTVAAASGGGIDPSISAPVLTLATANDTYPPQFDIGLDDTALVGDTIRLQWDNDADFSSLAGNATNVIDAGEASANAATFAGLSAISSGTHSFRARVERGAGYSDWSNIVIQGPPAAPTLAWTSGTSQYDPAFTITGIQVDDTVTLEIDDSDTFTSLFDSATNLVDLAEASDGALTFPDIATLGFGTTYYARVKITRGGVDSAWSNVESKAMDAAPVVPTRLVVGSGLTGAGVDRNRYIDVDASGLLAEVNTTLGEPCWVRALAPMPIKAHWEATLAAWVDGDVWMGVAESGLALGPTLYPKPGNGSTPGLSLRIGNDSEFLYYNGALLGERYAQPALASGRTYSLDVDQGTNAITIKRSIGGSVVTIFTVTLGSNIPASWTALVAGNNGGSSWAVNFGASAWTIAPLADHTGW